MGANNSHADSNLHGHHGYEGKKSHHHHHHNHHHHAKTGLSSDHILNHSKKNSSSRGKPSPPSQPRVTEVARNSVTLSWLPPRHNSGNKVFAYTVEMTTPAEPKAWSAVTKSCQGNSYQVKNLKPESQYIFRIRAENIHGVSKASRPSDVVETKLYEVEEVYTDPAGSSGEDRARNAPRRRHSINLHLEGGVTSILNHTDIQVKAAEPKTSSSCQELDKDKDKDGQRSRSNTLQRDVAARSSLQSRKRSLPILLPGTKTHSLSKLRDSQTFPNIKAKAGEGSTDSLLKRPGLRNRSASDAHSSCSGSKEDVTDAKSYSSKDESSTDDDLSLSKRDSKRDSKTSSERDSRIEEEDEEEAGKEQEAKEEEEEEEDSDNPWERDDSVREVTDRIRTAPLSDDIKIALYARTVPEDSTAESGQNIVGRSLHTVGRDGGNADFRTLQRLLHSDEIIVKPTRSLPDVASVGKSVGVAKNNNNNYNNNNNNNNKLTTIQDLDEDDESVRVTTL